MNGNRANTKMAAKFDPIIRGVSSFASGEIDFRNLKWAGMSRRGEILPFSVVTQNGRNAPVTRHLARVAVGLFHYPKTGT
jgi:hypothetical protein